MEYQQRYEIITFWRWSETETLTFGYRKRYYLQEYFFDVTEGSAK